ncbi:glutaminyl-peptide cyclotransferase [Pseudochryseolinea flava]|uniref:Glutaminyl-peptide cyclotransferase n=1 Tax=Pseudochryseolinea flava TaxID=2059302 RepID=A0A364Y2Y8_9BACT|nr:glutaminyl-peptide cyclotransferase [Pseudochryseolinea flava]RAW01052.1 glutaminyl-peptide cyclotransferase [Pseudochryseolinea flava]
MRYILPCLAIIAIASILESCGGKPSEDNAKDSLLIDYTVVNTLPHNTESYIQGLVIHDNKILESTGQPGQEGQSWIAEVNPATGAHDKKVLLDEAYFGEGITILNNKIYQLTWTTKKGFIYDAKTYKQLRTFEYPMEGWGLTHNNAELIMSDGTEKIHFKDTATLADIRTINVTENGKPVKHLNELEFIDGFIFANVWQTNLILKIDPSNGNVVGKLDCTQLTERARGMYPNAEVLNGIAYDKNSKALLITGKLWPQAFLIKLKK